MRTLRKRLVCANRGEERKSKAAMDKVAARYLEKMKAKGWELQDGHGYQSEGNAFFAWERYMTLVKK